MGLVWGLFVVLVFVSSFCPTRSLGRTCDPVCWSGAGEKELLPWRLRSGAGGEGLGGECVPLGPAFATGLGKDDLAKISSVWFGNLVCPFSV